MEELVLLLQDAHTYERRALEAWFARQRECGEPLRSPATGAAIEGEPVWALNRTVQAAARECEEQRQR